MALVDRPHLSTLTVMELVSGLEKDGDRVKIDRLLQEALPNFYLIDFDFAISTLAGEISGRLEKESKRIGIADTGIAATALDRGSSLVTANTIHFQRIIELGYPLKLWNWRLP